MANIDLQNISDLDLNGNSLFDDSESFITELDDNGESVIGGHKSHQYCMVSNVRCHRYSRVIVSKQITKFLGK